MRSIVLLTVIIAGCYYYHLHQEQMFGGGTKRSASSTADAASKPSVHYHSPLDPSNNHNSAGYYSSAPRERYEVSGPRSTTPTRVVRKPHAEPSEDPTQP